MRTNRILVVTMIMAVATVAAGLHAQKRDDSAELIEELVRSAPKEK